jgi:peroxiredoxin
MRAGAGAWVLALAVVAATAFVLYSGSSTPRPVGRGVDAPPFDLPGLSDAQRLSADSLRGKVVLLNFWATWCKPCEDEMPAMERLYRVLADTPFELVAVSVDSERSDVEAFVQRLGLTFPILLDPDQEVAALYQTFRFPESLLIDADGVVVERYVGSKEWDADAYVAQIRRLME